MSNLLDAPVDRSGNELHFFSRLLKISDTTMISAWNKLICKREQWSLRITGPN